MGQPGEEQCVGNGIWGNHVRVQYKEHGWKEQYIEHGTWGNM